MEEFLTKNADTILIIIKVFLILYAILSSIGVIKRIVKKFDEKLGNAPKTKITRTRLEVAGFIIYNVIGAHIFLIALIVLYYVANFLLSSTA